MADTRQCNSANQHEPHEWSHVVKQSYHDEIGTREYHWCEGVTFFSSIEGTTEKLAQVTYRDLTNLTFDLTTREKVKTRFVFEDLLVGDSKATVTVVDGDDRWAVVDIRLLARKPFVVRELDEEEAARRLF